MQNVRVAIRRLSTGLPLPTYATPGAAGMDLSAAVDDPLVVEPGQFVRIPCGFALALPVGLEAQVRPRSGLAARHGITVLNAPGTIDSDYRGEVQVILINHGPQPFRVERGMRIAQLVVAPVSHVEWEDVDALPLTQRDAGGFGHTGA